MSHYAQSGDSDTKNCELLYSRRTKKHKLNTLRTGDADLRF